MSHFEEIEFLASDNMGYFTSSAARAAGVVSCELDRWRKMGRLENPARGVYRLANYPPSALEPYVLGTLAVGEKAYIYGESVLAMLNLVPTDPSRLFVASPGRVRRKTSPSLLVVSGRADERVEYYEGVPAQHIMEAIRSSRGYVRHDRRVRAAAEGLRQGYLTKSEWQVLSRELKNETSA